ncbi:MAG: terminase small subunit [Anaerovibrio sp.]|nr:terminase small subunit [Anaerovibrio sp.]
MKLSVKQKRFIDEYIITGNASEAARRAGYSPKTADRIGNENLKKLVIQQAMADRLKELDSKKTASVKEVLEFLTSTLRGEILDENIVVEGVGDGVSEARTMETRVSSRDRLKAAELLLKRYPRQLDEEEQIARIKKLASEADKLDISNDTDDVIIVDDWSEVGEDAESDT